MSEKFDDILKQFNSINENFKSSIQMSSDLLTIIKEITKYLKENCSSEFLKQFDKNIDEKIKNLESLKKINK